MADLDRREFIAAVGLGAASGFLGTGHSEEGDLDPSPGEGLIFQGAASSVRGPDPWRFGAAKC